MTWKKFQNHSRFHGISVRPTTIMITASAYRELNKPTELGIEFDKEQKLIRFTIKDEFKVKNLAGNYINCSLGKIMPCGRYALENGIFKLIEIIK